MARLMLEPVELLGLLIARIRDSETLHDLSSPANLRASLRSIRRFCPTIVCVMPLCSFKVVFDVKDT